MLLTVGHFPDRIRKKELFSDVSPYGRQQRHLSTYHTICHTKTNNHQQKSDRSMFARVVDRLV